LDGSGDNRTITSTLGISTTLNQTAPFSINLKTGTTPVSLQGVPGDNYIAGTHAGVHANDVVNLCGFATVTNLSVAIHYICVWAGGNGSSTFTSPTVNIVVLKIKN
jgi:hypothetical protein